MTYQLIILTGLLLFFTNLILNLLMLKKPSLKAKLPDDLPFVSVLIPARNEEENIGDCLTSILKQNYPNFEVLVLDDNSADKTSEIVRKIEHEDKRVHLINGKPLPANWAGKCYACYQLAQNASGDWLLFVDADTISERHMLNGTLQVALANNVSMLSGFPRQQVSGLTQKIVIPVLFYFAIMTWFPLWWFHRSKGLWPTLAIGQFLLFKKDDYWKIGGHQLVKARIMEDVWFGIEMSKYGLRTLSIDLSKTMTTKMYRNLGSMAEGCIKWFYSVAALSPLALVVFVFAAYIFYLAPFYWAFMGLFSSSFLNDPSTEFNIIIITQISILLSMRIISDLYFKGESVSFIFHPLGIAFLILAALSGAARRALGAGVIWKDRVYESITHIK